MKMKNRNLLLLFLFFLHVRLHPSPDNGISITITNLRNDKGQVLICLFKDGDGYPDKPEKAFRKSKATIVSGNKAVISFSGLPTGNYSIVALHDENNNMKMDKNWYGLPKEGYGFSNNAMGTFGPPGIRKASFHYTMDKQTAISINLRY